MKEINYFHESYYDHSCSIVPEQDVLQTDIIGRDGLSNMKRWWNGLFLLSYNDERSRVYYTSSHSIRADRKKQFRYYNNRIHPLSKFRNVWDCLLLWTLILNHVLFHHNSSMILADQLHVFYYICVVLESIVIIDLYVNFKTGYINKKTKQIILDTVRGRMQYCSTKLFLHCTSAIPLQLIMLFRYGSTITCVKCKSNKFMCVLRILTLLKLRRIYESSEYLTRDRGSFEVTNFYRLFRIILLGFTTMLNYIDICDTLSLWIILISGHIDDTSFYGITLKLKFDKKSTLSNYYFLSRQFARISKSLLLFSFGFKERSESDKMTSLIAYVISNGFYIWGLLGCYTVISRKKFSQDRCLLNKATSMNLAKSRQLPDQLSLKMMRYHELKITEMKLTEKQNGLLLCLPKILKKEALMSCYRRRVARVIYFSDWPLDIISELVMLLEEENYLQGDIVADNWVQGDGLMIIDVGVMAVFTSKHEEVGHLIDGDYFGELSLVTDREVRTSYVVAVTPCKILLLPKNSFRNVMRNYKYLFFKMKAHLQEKYLSRDKSTILLDSAGSVTHHTDSTVSGDEAKKPDTAEA